MIAHRRESEAVSKITRMVTDQAVKITPKVHPRSVADPQDENNIEKRAKILADRSLARFDAVAVETRKAVQCPSVIFLRTIYIAEDILIAFDQPTRIHSGNEIDRTIGVISGAHIKQSLF